MAKADLIKQAQELGLQLTGKETIPQLEALIASAPKPDIEENTDTSVSEEGSENESQGDESEENQEIEESEEDESEDDQDEADADEEETPTPQADTYYVYNAQDEFVKFFTVAEHGADAEKKAKALAEEIGGRVQ
jgi:cobalamin biosynthesis protein CobT